ncbi:MAG: ribonuclease E/G [Acetobacteraceae bacterium]|nr:ribonuclease E/G [Acetobacteraceae bacterium]
MTKRMLIDATHAEETRVVVLDGNRLEDFDVESSTKKQLKGNIYLAKVVRVEPSLQAAFVEYGGGRHGFLAFGEIHPDYYQIPIADRQRLIALQAEEARADEEGEDAEDEQPPAAPAQAARIDAPRRRGRRRGGSAAVMDTTQATQNDFGELGFGEVKFGEVPMPGTSVTESALNDAPTPEGDLFAVEPAAPELAAPVSDLGNPEPTDIAADVGEDATVDEVDPDDSDDGGEEQPMPESLGGEGDTFEGNGAEEARQRRTARFLRNYRIQEVIHRRQIMLIQVVKEERGGKGAALTTYISLAGRFCVLMPNSPRGGGISRKITSAADRRRLKEITAELEIPQGMGLIVRTAGAARPKTEIKRDGEYLMRLWDDIRENTMKSSAPALIYEEASLIKRSIRDVYSRDVEEILVDGAEAWKAARDFMRMLMPAHAKKVIPWRPQTQDGQSLFARYSVEAQLDAMVSPTVQLKSGGYLVINQAEALVAIDVNSGRSTRERGIEETALRTNMEAAEEVARQLRLRDLAGLIVIDFIDMESRKHNGMVERKLKDSLKNDRARIQVGQISHFGLMEMSRQRLRPSLAETSFVICPHCSGLGHVRSTESSAIHVLRAIEEEGARQRSGQIMVRVAGGVALYLLNHKRDRLIDIEARYGMFVHFTPDDSLIPPEVRIDRLRPPLTEDERPRPRHGLVLMADAPITDDDIFDNDDDLIFDDDSADSGEAVRGAPVASSEAAPTGDVTAAAEEAERGKRRRRRRRSGRRDGSEDSSPQAGAESSDEPGTDGEIADNLAVGAEAHVDPALARQPDVDPNELDESGHPRALRHSRRNGPRRRRDGRNESAPAEADGVPSYTGPVQFDGGGNREVVDIFELMARAEAAEAEIDAESATDPTSDQGLFEISPAPVDATAPQEMVPVVELKSTDVAAATAKSVIEVSVVDLSAHGAEPEIVGAKLIQQEAEEPVQAAILPQKPAPAASEVFESVVMAAPESGLVILASVPETDSDSVQMLKPIMVGVDPSPDAAPKKGWWRR